VLVTAGLLGYTFIAGNTPFLGLDLQGGVAVILSPSGPAEDEQLDDAVSIIRSRVDAIGVAEPEITRQGGNISVEIPGVENRQQAIDLVGQTGELAFRPVLAETPTGFLVGDDGEPISIDAEVEGVEVEVTPGGDGDTGNGNGDGTPPVAPGEGDESDEGALPWWRAGPWAPPANLTGEFALGAQAQAPGGGDPGDLDPGDLDLGDLDLSPEQIEGLLGEGGDPAGPPEITVDPQINAVVVGARYDTVEGQRIEVARYQMGPASLTGAGLEGASSGLDERGQWVVRPVFRGGADGIDAFNVTASQCFSRTPECPTGLFAITLDGDVISALGVQAPNFARDQIVISGGFDEQSARDLATVLRYGALPVELEVQSVQEVSASLGRDALRAGVAAGIIGILLVAIYMFVSYRLLGLTAIAKLLVELGLLWAIVAWLGSTQGLALTLAGVTGIVVSIGLSVDSNVVFFETIKEDLRNGRSLRSASERSFAGAWRTIVKADLASLIAAVLLYALAVGPVRGFAFYLGLATVLDLIVGWFFMRSSVAFSLRSRLAGRRPRLFGLPPVADASPAPTAATTGRDAVVEVT
jgi:preprotein translocase subunit SecD